MHYALPLTFPPRFGPESFHEALKISAHSEASNIDWSKFNYMVFDVPNSEGTYAERYSLLGTVLKSLNSLLMFASQSNGLVCNQPDSYMLRQKKYVETHRTWRHSFRTLLTEAEKASSSATLMQQSKPAGHRGISSIR